jgi:hypothetical protein
MIHSAPKAVNLIHIDI